MSTRILSRLGAALIYFLLSIPFVGVVLLVRLNQMSLLAFLFIIGIVIAVIGGVTKIGSP